MASKRKAWVAYKVEYDNGEYRYLNSLSAALSHANAMAKSMTVVCLTCEGKLLARWSRGFRDGSVKVDGRIV